MSRLTDLPNIGPVLAANLERVGVESPEQLRSMGAETAFLKIRTEVDPTACLHQLEALAGAVEGIAKKELSPARKEELKRWHRSL